MQNPNLPTNTSPEPVIVQQPEDVAPTFKQQAFGPWTTNDPKIQRTIVRTRASSGITQRRFQATYPPAPTIAQTRTALAGAAGFEFAINVVGGKNVAGYNIYSSVINNPNVAKLIQYKSQPPIVSTSQLQTLKIQDTTAATPFYWVSSVNKAGQESARIPITGNPAPTPPPTAPLPPGGASGGGSGGGAVGRSGQSRIGL